MISLCIASRNHAALLDSTLGSIFRQGVDDLEVIVTNDGSTDDTDAVLERYPVTRLYRQSTEYRNGVIAKNMSLMEARGDIIIQQSDDVIHSDSDSILHLIESLQEDAFSIATVYDYDTEHGTRLKQYTGPENKRPLFFLGACRRSDICKIGGYDPDFAKVIWYDDNWHADGLMRGLGLRCDIIPVVGLHQAHPRPPYTWTDSKALYESKVRSAEAGGSWFSSAGSWPYVSGVSVSDILDKDLR